MIDFLNEAQELKNELFDLRKNFHREPELGNHEFKTASKIENFLNNLGIENHRILDTAIIADLNFKKSGKKIAFRADIDALPIQENTNVDFASQNPGIMHACGHDIHISALLGAALLLKNHENDLKGSVRFLFQPDEEGSGGAERMIKENCLENVNAVFGAHVSPEIPVGHIGVKYYDFYAAAELFDITIIGKSSHGAERYKGVDAIQSASEIVNEILSLNDSNSVVSVGTFNAGSARNIISDRAKITGIVRTFGIENREALKKQILEKTRNVCIKHNSGYEAEFSHGYVGVINDEKMTDLVKITAKNILGNNNVHIIQKHTFMTEDFGYFLLKRPGSFYHIGAGCDLPLHNNSFLPDENSIIIGAAVHAAVAYKFLNERT